MPPALTLITVFRKTSNYIHAFSIGSKFCKFDVSAEAKLCNVQKGYKSGCATSIYFNKISPLYFLLIFLRKYSLEIRLFDGDTKIVVGKDIGLKTRRRLIWYANETCLHRQFAHYAQYSVN